MRKTRVAIDFDGTIHAYSKGWHDGSIYDPPLPGAMDALEDLYQRGYELWIFTCRVHGDPGYELGAGATVEGIVKWLEKYRDGRSFVIKPQHITGRKPVAELYIDDRSLRFTAWDETLPVALELLEAHEEWLKGAAALAQQ